MGQIIVREGCTSEISENSDTTKLGWWVQSSTVDFHGYLAKRAKRALHAANQFLDLAVGSIQDLDEVEPSPRPSRRGSCVVALNWRLPTGRATGACALLPV